MSSLSCLCFSCENCLTFNSMLTLFIYLFIYSFYSLFLINLGNKTGRMEIPTAQVLIFQRAHVATKWDTRSRFKVGVKGNAVKNWPSSPPRHIPYWRHRRHHAINATYSTNIGTAWRGRLRGA